MYVRVYVCMYACMYAVHMLYARHACMYARMRAARAARTRTAAAAGAHTRASTQAVEPVRTKARAPAPAFECRTPQGVARTVGGALPATAPGGRTHRRTRLGPGF